MRMALGRGWRPRRGWAGYTTSGWLELRRGDNISLGSQPGSGRRGSGTGGNKEGAIVFYCEGESRAGATHSRPLALRLWPAGRGNSSWREYLGLGCPLLLHLWETWEM